MTFLFERQHQAQGADHGEEIKEIEMEGGNARFVWQGDEKNEAMATEK